MSRIHNPRPYGLDELDESIEGATGARKAAGLQIRPKRRMTLVDGERVRRGLGVELLKGGARIS